MTDPKQTYMRLSSLARDQAGTPEGETAARIAEKMRDRYGPDVETSAEELATVRLSFSNTYEKTILGRVALYLGLTAYTVGRRRTDGKGMRYLDVLDLEGPASIVQLAKPLYDQYKEKASRYLELSLGGWLFGALPLPPPPDLDSRPVPEISPEDLEIALAGQRAGSQNQYRKQIGAKS